MSVSYDFGKKAEEDAKKYKEALEQEGPKFEAIVKYMPTELSEFEVMEVLSTEVKAAGGRVKSTNAKALPQNDKDLYHTIGVDLTLEITYSQLLLFLSYLTKTDKIITLKQVTMSKRDKEIEGESLLSFSGQFEAYKYNPKSTSEASNAQ